MKHLLKILLLFTLLCLPSIVNAQAGIFIQDDCTILSPITYKAVCFNTGSGGTLNQGEWHTYDGVEWIPVPLHQAVDVLFTPTTGSDWDDPDPENVGSALDYLASIGKLTTTSAGAPGVTDCLSTIHYIVDTSTPELYYCPSGAGSAPVKVHFKSLSFVQMNGDSGSVTAVAGGTTLIQSGGANLTNTCDDGTDTCTMTIDNHVKSAYFLANALTTDGTQCATPALATINSGPRIYTIICADNDGSTIFGHAVMPDSWNAGTLTFELEYVQTAANTGALNSDISCQAKGPGETINNTDWGSEVAIDDAAVTGSNAVDHTTSGAVTCGGTPAAGDTVFFRWQLDAGGTTTTVASLHILGIKMEYTVVGAGSD